ncbi:hypothetical protein JW935_03055 [candidate division KSB1 bacterium]|nr:hypothetical protein [candidate division KSB1 bacterium]
MNNKAFDNEKIFTKLRENMSGSPDVLNDTITNACRHMKKLPVSPYFTSRVMKRFEKQVRQSFWKAFDIIPMPVVQVVGAICIAFLLSLLFYPQQKAPAAVSPTELEIAFTQNIEPTNINTDNQALQFAFDITLEQELGEIYEQ